MTCKLIGALIRAGVYTTWVQNRLVQAAYYRDWVAMDRYLRQSVFLADINNEGSVWNATYATNMRKLNKLILLMFNNDTMVVPKETAVRSFKMSVSKKKI